MSDRITIHDDPDGTTQILFDGLVMAHFVGVHPTTFVDAFIEEITEPSVDLQREIDEAVDDIKGEWSDQCDERVATAEENQLNAIRRQIKEFADDL